MSSKAAPPGSSSPPSMASCRPIRSSAPTSERSTSRRLDNRNHQAGMLHLNGRNNRSGRAKKFEIFYGFERTCRGELHNGITAPQFRTISCSLLRRISMQVKVDLHLARGRRPASGSSCGAGQSSPIPRRERPPLAGAPRGPVSRSLKGNRWPANSARPQGHAKRVYADLASLFNILVSYVRRTCRRFPFGGH
jgi:hypothetical protein